MDGPFYRRSTSRNGNDNRGNDLDVKDPCSEDLIKDPDHDREVSIRVSSQERVTVKGITVQIWGSAKVH
ncbi:MAG TPA: hypothetical protein PLV56_05955 [Synergistales bacterium]|nr:hypothetical protein [Synergistales bacterium]